MPLNTNVDENEAVNTIRFLCADAIQSVNASASGLQRGAYVLGDLGSQPAQIILMATGSEVSLIVKASEILKARLAVEAGVPLGRR